ncbi:hypothetical protein BCAR13_410104 [Paraburkholderia caribensis]|nr:hypothetical protein BCAR13_410104 [Paraburkholderia caribensis]
MYSVSAGPRLTFSHVYHARR